MLMLYMLYTHTSFLLYRLGGNVKLQVLKTMHVADSNMLALCLREFSSKPLACVCMVTEISFRILNSDASYEFRAVVPIHAYFSERLHF